MSAWFCDFIQTISNPVFFHFQPFPCWETPLKALGHPGLEPALHPFLSVHCPYPTSHPLPSQSPSSPSLRPGSHELLSGLKPKPPSCSFLLFPSVPSLTFQVDFLKTCERCSSGLGTYLPLHGFPKSGDCLLRLARWTVKCSVVESVACLTTKKAEHMAPNESWKLYNFK